jgi:hypothetical protein
MDVVTSVCSYQLQEDEDIQGCNFNTLERLSCNLLYEHNCCINIHSYEFLVDNFYVSSTEGNAHAKLPRYV